MVLILKIEVVLILNQFNIVFNEENFETKYKVVSILRFSLGRFHCICIVIIVTFYKQLLDCKAPIVRYHILISDTDSDTPFSVSADTEYRSNTADTEYRSDIFPKTC